MNWFGKLTLLSACTTALLAGAEAQASLVALHTYDNAADLGHDSSGNGNNLLSTVGASSGGGKYGSGLDRNGCGGMLYSGSGTLAGLPLGGSS